MNPEIITNLAQKYGGIWGRHPEYTVKDWQYEVINGDTRSGYWEWVSNKLQ